MIVKKAEYLYFFRNLLCVRVCLCACVRVRAWVRVCVCERERERERKDSVLGCHFVLSYVHMHRKETEL